MKRRLLIVLMILIACFSINVYAEEFHYPTESFSLEDTYNRNYIRSAYVSLSMTSTYIEEFAVPFYLKTKDGYPVYLLSKNLKVPTSNEIFALGNGNPSTVLDSGLLYILMHGYGYGKVEDSVFYQEPYGEVDITAKHYDTQLALWLYIYQNKDRFKDSYCANDGCLFIDRLGNSVSYEELYKFVKKAGDINNYSFLKYIIDLVDKANTYEYQASSIDTISINDINYSFNNDATLMMTDYITPTPKGNKNNYLYYQVSIDDPNQYGAYVVDSNENEIFATTQAKGSFKVVVPIKDDVEKMNLKSIQVTIKAYFNQEKVYEYHVSNSTEERFSNILFSYIPYKEEISSSFTLRNFIQVAALSPSSDNLSGVTMILRNKNNPDEVLQKWVSRDTPHQLFLDDGDYTLCEEDTPNGYIATNKCIDFKVDGESVTYLKMQNEQQVEVPDTGIFQSSTIYWIGSITIIMGLTIIFITIRKKDKNY